MAGDATFDFTVFPYLRAEVAPEFFLRNLKCFSAPLYMWRGWTHPFTLHKLQSREGANLLWRRFIVVVGRWRPDVDPDISSFWIINIFNRNAPSHHTH